MRVDFGDRKVIWLKGLVEGNYKRNIRDNGLEDV